MTRNNMESTEEPIQPQKAEEHFKNRVLPLIKSKRPHLMSRKRELRFSRWQMNVSDEDDKKSCDDVEAYLAVTTIPRTPVPNGASQSLPLETNEDDNQPSIRNNGGIRESIRSNASASDEDTWSVTSPVTSDTYITQRSRVYLSEDYDDDGQHLLSGTNDVPLTVLNTRKDTQRQKPSQSATLTKDVDLFDMEADVRTRLVSENKKIPRLMTKWIKRMDSILKAEGDENQALIAVSKMEGEGPVQVEFFVSSLLRNGANPNTRHVDSGRTPLHYIAGRKGYENVALTLLKWGAAPDARDFNHMSPLDVSYFYKYDRMTSLLIQHTESSVIRERFTPEKFASVASEVTGNHTKFRLYEMIEGCQMKRSVLAVLDCLSEENEETGKVTTWFKALQCIYIEAKPININISTKFTSAYQVITKVGDKDYLSHRVTKSLIELKWRQFKKYYLLGLILSLMAAACLTAAAFLAMAVDDPAYYDTSKVAERMRITCEFVVCVWMMIKIIQEIFQCAKFGHKYWSSFWNYLDILSATLLLSVIPLRAAHKREQWAVFSAGYLLSIARLIKFFAIKWSLLTYVQIIKKMWKEFVAFMLLCLVVFVACIGSFAIALRMEQPKDLHMNMTKPIHDASYWQILVSASRALLEDDPSESYYDNEKGYRAGIYPTILILAFAFITMVILMNVLIAQLTDIYQRVKAKAQMSALVNRARIVASLEQDLWTFRVLARASCLPGKLFKMIFKKQKELQELLDHQQDKVESNSDDITEKMDDIQHQIFEQSSLLLKIEEKLEDMTTEVLCTKCRSPVYDDDDD